MLLNLVGELSKTKGYSLYITGLILCLYCVSKEVVIFDEETVLIFTFTVFFYLAYNQLSKVIGEVFTADANSIRTEVKESFVNVISQAKEGKGLKELLKRFGYKYYILRQDAEIMNARFSESWFSKYAHVVLFMLSTVLLNQYQTEVRLGAQGFLYICKEIENDVEEFDIFDEDRGFEQALDKCFIGGLAMRLSTK